MQVSVYTEHLEVLSSARSIIAFGLCFPKSSYGFHDGLCIEKIVKSMPQLERLSLIGADSFEHSGSAIYCGSLVKALPNLKELFIDIGKVECGVLQAILSNHPLLQKLSLSYIDGSICQHIAHTCPLLTDLTIGYSSAVRDKDISEFASIAGRRLRSFHRSRLPALIVFLRTVRASPRFRSLATTAASSFHRQ